MIKLFITDLDDTLYSWIAFLIPAFYAMAEEVSHIVNIPMEQFLGEYKLVHQNRNSLEYPYATLMLPSVQKKYHNLSRDELIERFSSAFDKFNAVRKKRLTLYPFAKESFDFLAQQKITIVGYTESAEENGFYRLKCLNLDQYFKDVYVSDTTFQRPDHIPPTSKTHIARGKNLTLT